MTPEDLERMGQWHEEIWKHQRGTPAQLCTYTALRHWAYSTLATRARQTSRAFGLAQLDYVIAATFLGLDAPRVRRPAAEAAVAPPQSAADAPTLGRGTRLALGTVAVCVFVLGVLAGRGGMREEVLACVQALTPQTSQAACPDWMQRP